MTFYVYLCCFKVVNLTKSEHCFFSIVPNFGIMVIWYEKSIDLIKKIVYDDMVKID